MPPIRGTTNQSSASHSHSRGSSYQPTGTSMVTPSPSDNSIPWGYRPCSGSNGPYMMGIDQFGLLMPAHQYPMNHFFSTIAARPADGQSCNAHYPNGSTANPSMGSSNLNAELARTNNPGAQLSFDGAMDMPFPGQYNAGMASGGRLHGPDSALSPGQSTLPPVSPAPSSAYQPHSQASR